MPKSSNVPDFEIVEGVVLTLSGKKVVLGVFVGLLLAGVGLVALFGSGMTCLAGFGMGPNPQNTHPGVLFAFAGGLVLMAALGVAAGGYVGWRGMSSFFKKERFVLGKEAIQWVVGNESASISPTTTSPGSN